MTDAKRFPFTRRSFVAALPIAVTAAAAPELEVHIFPEAQRGTGEGSRDYDLEPKSSMTNGGSTSMRLEQILGLSCSVLTHATV